MGGVLGVILPSAGPGLRGPWPDGGDNLGPSSWPPGEPPPEDAKTITMLAGVSQVYSWGHIKIPNG